MPSLRTAFPANFGHDDAILSAFFPSFGNILVFFGILRRQEPPKCRQTYKNPRRFLSSSFSFFCLHLFWIRALSLLLLWLLIPLPWFLFSPSFFCSWIFEMFSSETLVSPRAARLLLTGSTDLPKVGTQLVLQASCSSPPSPPPSSSLPPSCEVLYPHAFSGVPVLSPHWLVLQASGFAFPPRGILKVAGASSEPSHARRVAFGEVTVDNYPKWIGQASAWGDSPWCQASWKSVDESDEDSDEDVDSLAPMTDVPCADYAVSDRPVVGHRQEEDLAWKGSCPGLSGAYSQDEDLGFDDESRSPIIWDFWASVAWYGGVACGVACVVSLFL